MRARSGRGAVVPARAIDASGVAAAPLSCVPFAPPCFNAVYATHSRFLWRSLRSLGVSEEQLDDACQDAALLIFRYLPSFEGRSSLRTWLYRIAQGVAANHRRGARRRRAQLVGMDDMPSWVEWRAPSHEPALEAADCLIKFASSLSDAERRLFVLGAMDALPIAELAARLALSIPEARRRRRHLRQRFERFLSQSRSPRQRSLQPRPRDA